MSYNYMPSKHYDETLMMFNGIHSCLYLGFLLIINLPILLYIGYSLVEEESFEAVLHFSFGSFFGCLMGNLIWFIALKIIFDISLLTSILLIFGPTMTIILGASIHKYFRNPNIQKNQSL